MHRYPMHLRDEPLLLGLMSDVNEVFKLHGLMKLADIYIPADIYIRGSRGASLHVWGAELQLCGRNGGMLADQLELICKH